MTNGMMIPHDYVHPHQRDFDRAALLKYGSDDVLAFGVEQVLDDPGFQRVLRKAGRPRPGESDIAASVLGTFRMADLRTFA